jgi:hypothetical protein
MSNSQTARRTEFLLTIRDPRQIVTNHLLHFLALDRSDPKKFQILQLIAALLGWDDGKLGY